MISSIWPSIVARISAEKPMIHAIDLTLDRQPEERVSLKSGIYANIVDNEDGLTEIAFTGLSSILVVNLRAKKVIVSLFNTSSTWPIANLKEFDLIQAYEKTVLIEQRCNAAITNFNAKKPIKFAGLTIPLVSASKFAGPQRLFVYETRSENQLNSLQVRFSGTAMSEWNDDLSSNMFVPTEVSIVVGRGDSKFSVHKYVDPLNYIAVLNALARNNARKIREVLDSTDATFEYQYGVDKREFQINDQAKFRQELNALLNKYGVEVQDA